MKQVQYALPEGWHWKHLDDVSEKITDGTHHSPKVQYSEWEPGRFKYITSKNIKNNGMKLDDISYIDKDIHDEIYARCAPELEDQLLTKDGAMTGTCCLNELNEPFSLLSSVALIKQNRSIILPKYLNYYLQSHVGQNFLLGDISGAAITRTNIKKLKSTPVPLAPYAQQKRIVEKLDALLTRIDTAIEHLQESVTLADALYASALDKEFSKLMKESDVLPFKKLVDNQDGRRIPIKAGERQNTHGTYPYYGATGVIDYVDDFIFEGERLLISEDGANLVARKYPIAFIADGKYWVNNHAHVVNALPDLTSNLYLKKFFAWVDLSSYITGSAQPKLSQGKLNTIPVPVPPLSEQTEIVVELDKAYQLTESLKKEVDEKLGILTSLKASILDSAFKGEL